MNLMSPYLSAYTVYPSIHPSINVTFPPSLICLLPRCWLTMMWKPLPDSSSRISPWSWRRSPTSCTLTPHKSSSSCMWYLIPGEHVKWCTFHSCPSCAGWEHWAHRDGLVLLIHVNPYILLLWFSVQRHTLTMCWAVSFPFRSQSKLEIAPPLHVVERYIELLCRYDPEQVYMFLKSSDNYRLEEALEVRKSNAVDCGC